jgi:hypothetical protein
VMHCHDPKSHLTVSCFTVQSIIDSNKIKSLGVRKVGEMIAPRTWKGKHGRLPLRQQFGLESLQGSVYFKTLAAKHKKQRLFLVNIPPRCATQYRPKQVRAGIWNGTCLKVLNGTCNLIPKHHPEDLTFSTSNIGRMENT